MAAQQWQSKYKGGHVFQDRLPHHKETQRHLTEKAPPPHSMRLWAQGLISDTIWQTVQNLYKEIIGQFTLLCLSPERNKSFLDDNPPYYHQVWEAIWGSHSPKIHKHLWPSLHLSNIIGCKEILVLGDPPGSGYPKSDTTNLRESHAIWLNVTMISLRYWRACWSYYKFIL